MSPPVSSRSRPTVTDQTDTIIDVVVVGAGPAGCALAAELADLGMSVVVVAPDPEARWAATYACWVDELPTWAKPLAAHQWESVLAWGRRRHQLARSYCVLDNAALQASLIARVGTQHLLSGVVRRVDDRGPAVAVTCADGATIRCRLVVDASGSSGLTTPQSTSPAVQAAIGVVVATDAAPMEVAAGGAVFMDWRPAPSVGGDDPTFVYVLDRGDGRRLVEETSLARMPALEESELRRRLSARLGAEVAASGDEEQVSIVMSSPSRNRANRVVPFGAAAGFVHPATGYSIATSLCRAPQVAVEIANQFRGGDRSIDHAKIHDAVWPRSARRTRALHDIGLAALLRLTADEVGGFFDVFFELPTVQWSTYLSTESSARRVSSVMWRIFTASPWQVRRQLIQVHPLTLLRAITG
jgi:lycopene beta-cyclase